MTTTDIAGLCKDLLRFSRNTCGMETNNRVNPDGPKAANTLERQAAEIRAVVAGMAQMVAEDVANRAIIERQAAEIERLRALLMLARPFVADDTEATCDLADRIDAALTGEDA